ncbi:hypothetical protein Ahy_A02g005370 [Arachis hypogaea]|uniref:Uncharacterized protein n=1 Tax=Arachis hypogaea TaxID=3818 RepID=A0A445E6W4_ARAHY|nr:hypothetical protein Ahy_A02g005370 [Arachis hypogaea]
MTCLSTYICMSCKLIVSKPPNLHFLWRLKISSFPKTTTLSSFIKKKKEKKERNLKRREGETEKEREGRKEPGNATEFAAAVALLCRRKVRTARERTAKREGGRISSPRSQRRRRPHRGSSPSRLATAATTKLSVVATEVEEREREFAKRGRARTHEGEERRRVKEKQKTMNAGEKEEVTVLLCRRRCRRLGSRPSPSHPVPVAIRSRRWEEANRERRSPSKTPPPVTTVAKIRTDSSSNAKKLDEVRAILGQSIPFQSLKVDLLELQGEPEDISKEKVCLATVQTSQN